MKCVFFPLAVSCILHLQIVIYTVPASPPHNGEGRGLIVISYHMKRESLT